jgi:predicted RNA methylase
MKTATVRVPDDVRDVLARATFDGNVVQLPELERELYVRTDKILKAAGGKWNRGRNGHVFTADPRPALGLALTGSLVDEKKTRQAFYSPAPVAKQLALLLIAHMGAIRSMLEPSAGEGAIAQAVRSVAPAVDITCVEIDAAACAVLRMQGHKLVHEGDFLTFRSPAGVPGGRGSRVLPYYDAVVMNPPFTGGQDVEHVVHAWSFVKQGGGILIAVVAPTWKTRRGAKWDRFRDLHARYAADDEIVLPAGTFKESGTDVVTHVVIWRLP